MQDQWPEHTKMLTRELTNRPFAQVLGETGFLVLIALTALGGNCCVLVVFYKTPRLIRSVTNYYVITLAISDIAFTLVAMLVTIKVSAVGKNAIGDPVGKSLGFIGFVLIYGSILTTTLIAANRLLYITKPLKYRRYFRRRSTLLMIGVIWVVSLVFNGAVCLSGEMTYAFYPGRLVYYPVFDNLIIERIMTFATSATFAVIPMSMTTVCYCKIYNIVRGHNATVSVATIPNQTGGTSSLTSDEIRITTAVLALVCGSVFCWVPCVVLTQLALYIPLPRSAQMAMTYMAFLASAVNPIIFTTFNKPFRRRFLKLCCFT